MNIIRDILQKKADPSIWTVAPNTSVFDALTLMAEKNIGAVLVMDSGRLVGILSERDYARKVVLRGRMSKETPVQDIMTEVVMYVTPTQTVEECMALMTNKHIRHLPVMEDGRLIGLISIGDVVKAQIADKEFTIEQLTNYITGMIR